MEELSNAFPTGRFFYFFYLVLQKNLHLWYHTILCHKCVGLVLLNKKEEEEGFFEKPCASPNVYKTMKTLRLGETSGLLITQGTPAFIWGPNASKTIGPSRGWFCCVPRADDVMYFSAHPGSFSATVTLVGLLAGDVMLELACNTKRIIFRIPEFDSDSQ